LLWESVIVPILLLKRIIRSLPGNLHLQNIENATLDNSRAFGAQTVLIAGEEFITCIGRQSFRTCIRGNMMLVLKCIGLFFKGLPFIPHSHWRSFMSDKMVKFHNIIIKILCCRNYNHDFLYTIIKLNVFLQTYFLW
jgi:hypothetical protein